MIEGNRQRSEQLSFVLEGSIDEDAAEKLKQEFRSLDSESVKEVVFDFSRVTYIGSAGIGKLLLFYKDVASRGGTIKVVHLPEPIFIMFKTLKLDSIFSLSR